MNESSPLPPPRIPPPSPGNMAHSAPLHSLPPPPPSPAPSPSASPSPALFATNPPRYTQALASSGGAQSQTLAVPPTPDSLHPGDREGNRLRSASADGNVRVEGLSAKGGRLVRMLPPPCLPTGSLNRPLSMPVPPPLLTQELTSGVAAETETSNHEKQPESYCSFCSLSGFKMKLTVTGSGPTKAVFCRKCSLEDPPIGSKICTNPTCRHLHSPEDPNRRCIACGGQLWKKKK
eukprot:TRINITY_DN26780_c0_g1_i1.p1 TRINITY_DN26780_c0_g1~~TRINITY_DN26780_c0_g1_i1.p1  ORF type:complete len:234 (+),score=20.81 TRINITY_DN26780_c0_g1_i1:38-739(+)